MERGKKREKHGCEEETSTGCLPYVPRTWIACSRTGEPVCSPGKRPDQESNLQTLGYRAALPPAKAAPGVLNLVLIQKKI